MQKEKQSGAGARKAWRIPLPYVTHSNLHSPSDSTTILLGILHHALLVQALFHCILHLATSCSTLLEVRTHLGAVALLALPVIVGSIPMNTDASDHQQLPPLQFTPVKTLLTSNPTQDGLLSHLPRPRAPRGHLALGISARRPNHVPHR